MSSTARRIKRTAGKALTERWSGRIGGVCPKCGHEPLQAMEAAQPAHLPICAKCGWRDPRTIRVLVLIRRPDDREDDEAEGVIVVSDSISSAVMRCVQKGWVTGVDRVRPVQISSTSLIPPTYIDRLLSPEQLIALGDANAPRGEGIEESAGNG